jgi:hypothetical protein
MNKQELQTKLDELGIIYDKRWGVPKLEALLPQEDKPLLADEPIVSIPKYSEEELAHIERAVSKADEKPMDVFLTETQKIMGEVTTPSGILIPADVLANFVKSQWYYSVQEGREFAKVFRCTKKGYTEQVREYNLQDHGQRFLQLAREFVDKNNQ